ncbi:MAG: DUF6020 family protein [Suipraeoptans sp.]
MNKRGKALIILFAFLSTYALCGVITWHRGVAASVVSILIFVGVCFLYFHMIPRTNRRLTICSLVLGLFFSAFLIIGRGIQEYDAVAGLTSVAVNTVLLTPFMAALVAAFLYYYDKVFDYIAGSKPEAGLKKLISGKNGTDTRFLIISFVLILVVWFICLLATYPGIYAYDSIFQMHMYTTGEVTSHHPIIHTYLLGGLISLGRNVFGSEEAGMLIYSLLQMIIMTGIFTYYIKRLKGIIPEVCRVLVLIFFAFVPYNILFSFSATKDVIFAGLFVIVVIKSVDLIKFENVKTFDCIVYIILTFLMCAFRNNGIYAYIFMAVVAVIVLRKKTRIRFALISVCVVGIWLLYTGPIYGVLGVDKGADAEMLSVPIQQLCKVVVSNPEGMSDEDLELAKEYMPLYEYFEPRISDNVKNGFNTELYNADKVQFLKLWLRVGIDNTTMYLEEWASLTLGYWYPDSVYPYEGAYHPYIEYDNSKPAAVYPEGEYTYLEQKSYIPALSKILRSFAYDTNFQRIPVLSLIFSPGFAFWIIALLIVLVIYKRDYKVLVILSFGLGLWITLIFSPVVLLCYMYPAMISIPIMLGIARKEVRL